MDKQSISPPLRMIRGGKQDEPQISKPEPHPGAISRVRYPGWKPGISPKLLAAFLIPKVLMYFGILYIFYTLAK